MKRYHIINHSSHRRLQTMPNTTPKKQVIPSSLAGLFTIRWASVLHAIQPLQHSLVQLRIRPRAFLGHWPLILGDGGTSMLEIRKLRTRREPRDRRCCLCGAGWEVLVGWGARWAQTGSTVNGRFDPAMLRDRSVWRKWVVAGVATAMVVGVCVIFFSAQSCHRWVVVMLWLGGRRRSRSKVVIGEDGKGREKSG